MFIEQQQQNMNNSNANIKEQGKAISANFTESPFYFR